MTWQRNSMPTHTDIRSPLCVQFERFLDEVIKDQEAGRKDAFQALSAEYGISVTASIMQAADVRKLQREKPRVI